MAGVRRTRDEGESWRFFLAPLVGGAGACLGFFVALILGIVAGMTADWRILFIDGESSHVTLPLLFGGVGFVVTLAATTDALVHICLSCVAGCIAMLGSSVFAGYLWQAGLTNSWELPG